MLRPTFGIPCASLLGLLIPLMLPRGTDAAAAPAAAPAAPPAASSFATPAIVASYTQHEPRNALEAVPPTSMTDANVGSREPPTNRAAPEEPAGAYAQTSKLHGRLARP